MVATLRKVRIEEIDPTAYAGTRSAALVKRINVLDHRLPKRRS